MNACDRCPCPDTCRRIPAYCQWMLADPPDPVHVLHIRNVSAESSRPASEKIPQDVGEMPPSYPPLARQLGSAVRAAGRAVTAAVTGQAVTVDETERKRRLAICHGCDQYVADDDRCQACGCRAKWKTRLATEHCPLEPPKW